MYDQPLSEFPGWGGAQEHVLLVGELLSLRDQSDVHSLSLLISASDMDLLQPRHEVTCDEPEDSARETAHFAELPVSQVPQCLNEDNATQIETMDCDGTQTQV